jgi:hypothetical protein
VYKNKGLIEIDEDNQIQVKDRNEPIINDFANNMESKL